MKERKKGRQTVRERKKERKKKKGQTERYHIILRKTNRPMDQQTKGHTL